MTSQVTKKTGGSIEITATIPYERITKERPKALKYFQESINIDGFRKGHIPEKVLVERVGEMNIIEEALNEVLPAVVTELFVEHKVASIGRPDIAVTKMALGSDVEIKVTSAVYPEITKLPNYTAIAKAIYGAPEETLAVTNEDVEKLLTEVRTMKASKDSGAAPTDDVPLPELTDALVQGLGPYKTVEEFKTKARENILEEKKLKATQKKRADMIEKIIAETEVEVPEILITYELDRMFARLTDDIARFNMKVEDYLTHIKKTKEEMQADWRDDARKNVVTQLVLSEISKKEIVVASKEDVERETQAVLTHHKEALPDRVRAYVDLMLTNEKVFAFLENGKK